MNENNLGSISSIVKPLSGHENFEENVIVSIFLYFFGKDSFSYSTTNKPSDRLIAVSTLSANLLPRFEFSIILSTIIDISCFTFLFRSGNSSIFKYFPSTLIFVKPLFLKFRISFLYSPFLPLTIGAKM